MTNDDDVYVATIDDLLRNCRSALIALLPAADQAMLTWTDDNQHRDWERLAECVFDVFVRGPIVTDRNQPKDEFGLARYDIDRGDYASSSWISCPSTASSELAFVRFLSEADPFDTVEAVEVDPATFRTGELVTTPWPRTGFTYVRRTPGGTEARITRVEADD